MKLFTTAAASPSYRRQPASRDAALRVQLEMIGTPAAGKTVTTLMLVFKYFESFLKNLRISASDPLALNALRNELFDRMSGFIDKPMDPTLIARGLNAVVRYGSQRVMDLSITDPVGHLLPGVTEASDNRVKQQYTDYCSGLHESSVLGVVIPAVPKDPTQQDCLRFDRNIRIGSAFLGQALEQRTSDARVSVFIAATKLDILASSGEEARRSLSNEHLLECFDDLVKMIGTSDRVAHAAIIPLSACGFGTMRLLKGTVRRNGSEPDDDMDIDDEVPRRRRDFLGEEPPYALKEETLPEPFNLQTLLAWSLWAGATPQLVDPDTAVLPELAAAIGQLKEILEDEDSWLIPIETLAATRIRRS